MSTSAPILTNTIEQSFYIDALNGASNVATFLDNFPDTVYSKSVDSHLFILMSALLGASGAGLLKDQYLQQRLQTDAGYLANQNLDELYSGAFGFNRLENESYIWDALAQLLPATERAEILSADASFRTRARLWLQAVRAGGSVLGISLAASSGLGQDVEAVENYKFLFDQQTDMPLGIPYLGSTNSLEEVILIPRNNIPNNVAQTISFTIPPTSGQFTIVVPNGPPYINLILTSTSGNTTLTVPNSELFTIGNWLNVNGATYICTNILSETLIEVNTPFTATHTGNVIIGRSETVPIGSSNSTIPFNVTADDIRSALAVVPVIGGINNIQCYGGPLPYFPIQVVFTGALANTQINNLIIKTKSDTYTGSVGLTPNNTNPIVDVSIAGTEIDNLNINFSESDTELMLKAVDILRPQTTFISVNQGQSLYTRQTANSYFADQTYTEVEQYVTGSPTIDWPPVDNVTNWIEDGIEHEAPQLAGVYGGQYTNFHNILNAIAYNQNALNDSNYNTPLEAPIQPFYASYYDVHSGQYNQAQQLLYPILSSYQDTGNSFLPIYAVANQPNQPAITAVTSNLVTLINDAYPSSYLNLPGANYQALGAGPFWSSAEMPITQPSTPELVNVDYLEIDLGSTQPVNYIYFEATNKPYAIDVAYEALDQINQREFVNAVIDNTVPSVTSLTYTASNTNPWTTVTLPITNTLGTMIYTRFIRIGFTRTSSGEPFLVGNQAVPYSIEVKNLRIGRIVNSFGESFTSVI